RQVARQGDGEAGLAGAVVAEAGEGRGRAARLGGVVEPDAAAIAVLPEQIDQLEALGVAERDRLIVDEVGTGQAEHEELPRHLGRDLLPLGGYAGRGLAGPRRAA